MSGLRRSFVFALLRLYKLTLSPVFQLFGAHCRHQPTCSHYCAECISRYGFWKGGWMSIARLQRCRPGGSSGYDPVPEKIPATSFWTPWRYGDWALTERPFPDDPHGDEIKRRES